MCYDDNDDDNGDDDDDDDDDELVTSAATTTVNTLSCVSGKVKNVGKVGLWVKVGPNSEQQQKRSQN